MILSIMNNEFIMTDRRINQQECTQQAMAQMVKRGSADAVIPHVTQTEPLVLQLHPKEQQPEEEMKKWSQDIQRCTAW